jgi:DNA mismatch repair protein MutS
VCCLVAACTNLEALHVELKTLNFFMQIDDTTFSDLSIFHQEEECSIFHKLNFTQTVGGKDWLAKFFSEPLSDIKKINDVQEILRCMAAHEAEWPTAISNGTVMVIEKFYEAPVDTIPDSPNLVNALSYKLLHAPDYSLVRYTVGHFADFVKGFTALAAVFDNDATPPTLRLYIQRAAQLVNHDVMIALAATEKDVVYSRLQTIYLAIISATALSMRPWN